MFNLFIKTLSVHDLAVVKVTLTMMKEECAAQCTESDNQYENSYYHIAEDFLDTLLHHYLTKWIDADSQESITKETTELYESFYKSIEVPGNHDD